MALPRINDDKPIYEVTLPTNKKTYRYRPFLVKEQRNILIASESESAREGVMAMLSCIESCAPDVKIEDMSTPTIWEQIDFPIGITVGVIATVLTFIVVDKLDDNVLED